MGDQLPSRRSSYKRRASTAGSIIDFDIFSSDDDIPITYNVNSYNHITTTPIGSRLSRGRPTKRHVDISSSNVEVESPKSEAVCRKSSRPSIKTTPYHHFPYEPSPNKKPHAINDTPIESSKFQEEQNGSTLCNVASTPTKSGGGPETKVRINRILSGLKDSEGYVNGIRSSLSSSSFSETDARKLTRKSLRQSIPSKRYVSQHTGDLKLRLSTTPAHKSKGVPGTRQSLSRTPKIQKLSNRKSSSSSSNSPVACHSKSMGPCTRRILVTPSRKSGAHESPGATTSIRGRGRPITPKERINGRVATTESESEDETTNTRKSLLTSARKSQALESPASTKRARGRPATRGKTPVTPKVRLPVGRRSTKNDSTEDDEREAKDKESDYNSGEATTASESEDDSTEESNSDEDEDVSDGDWNNKSRTAHGKNVSRRLDDMDFENALTPEVVKHLSTKRMENVTPRRLLQSFQGTDQESPNPESYFLAQNRLKFLPDKKIRDAKSVVPNDARKGKGGAAKKPRKGTRGTGGERIVNLPERPILNFSVTKEGNRVASSKLVVPLGGNKHTEEIDSLLRTVIIPDFPQWMHYMSEGFNVMLHGFGSKVSVFQAFKAHLDGEWTVITVNGLYPKLNPRKFLLDLCNSLDLDEKIRVVGTNMDAAAQDVYEQLRFVDHPRVFLLVKNFDNLALRYPSFLSVLCFIAQVKWIHILASSDTVNAFLGVNQNQTIQLNFCWIPCSTFQPYEEELSWVPGVFGEDSSSVGAKSTLQYVLKSLTGNARKAFSILASLQLAKTQGQGSKGKKSKEFAGIEFRDLARRCRERFIAHSDAALKTLLVEFVDHKLIKHSGKNKNVGNLLTIDLDKETLEELAKAGS